MTKINVTIDEQHVRFEQIRNQDYFMYNGAICCKLIGLPATYNAFDISDSRLRTFSDSAKVCPIQSLDITVVLNTTGKFNCVDGEEI